MSSQVFRRLSKEREPEMSMRHLARYLEINFCSHPFVLALFLAFEQATSKGGKKICRAKQAV